ncbi:U-box domain-containing protein 40 [Cynara cardunculus var. scolymus]|uniref:RING-type E3 ubiquitin transferase n=1 Tax=Cynara cardunculus var. scolymus TaxID=59895 RepID=A0A103XL57_CYNCS|nr:U-box domain-containing protein 40 [Cynara cardunculus var. scolymus]KVH92758.1 Armadillo [Cynara cardunculus var. scolymus]
MGTGGKHRWRFSLLRSPSNLKTPPPPPPPPPEFICPISGDLMADPVIVSSGQTFERNCVLACISLSFKPSTLPTTVDFTTVIPNLALKSAIINWCRTNSFSPIPQPLDIRSALNIVQALMNDSPKFPPRLDRLSSCLSSTSDESVVATAVDSCSSTPLPLLTTRPFCYSSSSSSEIENPVEEDEEIICKLRSGLMADQEDAAVTLRKITRTKQDARIYLCTPRLMAALRHLIVSRYSAVQVNSTAALVNLSLENGNKVKIVRSGIVPPLIDVLRGGFPEAQDHAAGALFSLALDDQNKTAIGVLGALPPLLQALRAGSDRSRHDSALALYHLSLVQSNRAKLVKLGSVPLFLNMLKSGNMTGRVMLVLCNLAGSVEGRAAMLDGGAVECLLGMVSRAEFDSDSTRECCLGALYGLSQGGLRFKGLAKEAGAEEVLLREEETAPERCKEKAKKILEVMRQKYEEETVDWEALLNSDELTRSRFELVYGKG